MLIPNNNNKITFSVNRQDSADAENDHTENAQLPRAEVIKRLRERSHPILLFGENELQSFKRLRRIEIQEPEANRVRYSLFLMPTPVTSSDEIRSSEVETGEFRAKPPVPSADGTKQQENK